MSDLSKFIQEGAKFMVADRPDIFTQEYATATLSRWFSDLSAVDMEERDVENPISIASGGFVLVRYYDRVAKENEYFLSRHILSFSTFGNGEQPYLFNWTKNGKLTDVSLDVED